MAELISKIIQMKAMILRRTEDTSDTEDDDRASRERAKDLRRIAYFLGSVAAVALAAAVSVGVSKEATPGALGSILLWVFASLAVGGAVGFLFGIPRSGLSSKARDAKGDTPEGETPASMSTLAPSIGSSPQMQPNTNLEEVSDWLTKIIVGLTLVHLETIRDEIVKISKRAAASFQNNPTPYDESTATALIVGFTLFGFVAMYLFMRLFVQGAIHRADRVLSPYEGAVRKAERVMKAEPLQVIDTKGSTPQEPVIPSSASVKAAQAVADVAPLDPAVVLKPLYQLASEYETLRSQEDYSPGRTRKMSEIAKQMRAHAIAAAPFISMLMSSPSPGEHLAASIILQMKYMPEHMQWLARRLVEERAFIGYQAASALFARVRVAGPDECKAIQEAVRTAKADRAEKNIAEESLDRLIDRILETK